MPRPAPSVRPAVGRRSLVAVAAASVALSGCDSLGGAGDEAPGTGAAPEDDPDLGALAEALETVDGAAALVSAATTASPGLAGRLAGLTAMHAEHHEALSGAAGSGGPEPTPPSPTTAPPTAAGAGPPGLAQVRAAERHLATRLAQLSLAARSGAFARLLAVMSAAVHQQLAALDGPDAA